MYDLHEYARFSLSISVGAGLVASGVGNALFSPRRWWGQVCLSLVGVVVAWGLATLFEAPAANVLPLLGVGLLLGVASLRSEMAQRFAHRAIKPFRYARVRWAAVAMTGALGMGYEALRQDCLAEATLEKEMAELSERLDRAEGVVVSGVAIRTDRGHSINGIVSSHPRTREQMQRAEQQLLTELSCGRQVIKRGEPSDNSNCHGWVFTSGQYGIQGRQVETILTDNGYRPVSQPAEGDVCVYRDSSGSVSHTAIVRSILTDGTVLVEGKWGWMGVYLHPVQASCYGMNFEYHRTERPTHVLAISTDAPSTVSNP